MIRSVSYVPTSNAGKYVRQLCNHWSHKLEVDQSDGIGIVRFPTATATMSADPEVLKLTLEAEDEATLERMKGVLATHLDRFAFREAPLPFPWSAAE
jgi:hypothetical protein